jgi:hypothetical protein
MARGQEADSGAFWLNPVSVGSPNILPLKDLTNIDFANLFGGIGGGKRRRRKNEYYWENNGKMN